MTTIEKQLEAIKRELTFARRALSNLETSDFETVEAIDRALSNVSTSVFEIELEGQPSREDELILA